MPPTSSRQGKLLDHERLGREEVNEWMVTDLGVDPIHTANEVDDVRGVHARFKFLEKNYNDQLHLDEDVDGADM